MRSRRAFCFNRLHHFNLPLAEILRLFGPVAARTITAFRRKPAWLTHLEYTDSDPWNQALGRAHREIHAWINRNKPSVFANLAGSRVDLSDHVIQLMVRELEGSILFQDLARRFAAERSLEPVIVPHFGEFPLPGAQARGRRGLLRLNLLLDHLAELVFTDGRSWLSLLSQAVWWLPHRRQPARNGMGGTPLARMKTLVRGISAPEIPESDSCLDFTWWVRKQLLDPSTTLFVLPVDPSPPARSRLSAEGVRWITERAVLALLSPVQCLLVLARSSALYLRRCFTRDLETAMGCRARARALLWHPVLSRSGVKLLLASLSDSWPEPSEISVARSLGARTVNWSYAASSFAWGRKIDPFPDRTVWRSVVVADECWTWTAESAAVLAQRKLIDASAGPRWVPIGPMMCGDSSWLALSPEEARAKLGLTDPRGFYLTVFDVPFYRDELRMREGHEWGPYTSLEAQRGLFQACVAALHAFPRLKLILKVKRLRSDDFLLPDAFHELSRNERVVLMGPTTDPYIPVAASDACVATPFTSPVLLADLSARLGIYLDTTGSARHTFQGAFRELICLDEKAFLDRLRDAMTRAPDPARAARARATLVEGMRERLVRELARPPIDRPSYSRGLISSESTRSVSRS